MHAQARTGTHVVRHVMVVVVVADVGRLWAEERRAGRGQAMATCLLLVTDVEMMRDGCSAGRLGQILGR